MTATDAGDLTISGGDVFDGESWHHDADLVIRDGRVAALASRTSARTSPATLDARNRLVLPGLIDAHLHLFPGFVQRLPAFGVTAAVDMFSTPDILATVRGETEDAARAGRPTAKWVSAGVGATVCGGHPRQLIGQGLYRDFPVLRDARSAGRFVDDRIDEGSRFIKVFLDGGSHAGQQLPTLDPASVEAVCAAAHDRGRVVLAHVTETSRALEALRCGVDGLAHIVVPSTEDVATEALVTELVGRGAFVIPTLVTIASALGIDHERLIGPDLGSRISPAWKRHLSARGSHLADPEGWGRTRDLVAHLARAGVPLLAGTDAAFPGVVPGASLHAELLLLRACGLSTQDALAAATSRPGRVFYDGEVGRLRPGAAADLIVVRGDTGDVASTQAIDVVVIGGRLAYVRPDPDPSRPVLVQRRREQEALA